MEHSVVFAGLDYHTQGVQVCVLDAQGRALLNRPCANDVAALRRLVGRGVRVQAAVEACTGSAELADRLIHEAGWQVRLAHPGYVRRMKQRPDKTDLSDARLLADLQRVGYLPEVWLAPPAIRELRSLTRHRQQLVERRRAIKQRISAIVRDRRLRAPEGVNPWTKRWLQWLQLELVAESHYGWIVRQNLEELELIVRRIEDTEDRLAHVTREDVLVQRLRQIRGLGLVTACVMRAEIGRFDRFHSGKQLANFCGLSPRNASSGERQADAGLIQACNRDLRALIIEAAHRLVRFDAQCCELAKRLRAAGKPACVVVAAVANRWLRKLYHELKVLSEGTPPAAAAMKN